MTFRPNSRVNLASIGFKTQTFRNYKHHPSITRHSCRWRRRRRVTPTKSSEPLVERCGNIRIETLFSDLVSTTGSQTWLVVLPPGIFVVPDNLENLVVWSFRFLRNLSISFATTVTRDRRDTLVSEPLNSHLLRVIVVLSSPGTSAVVLPALGIDVLPVASELALRLRPFQQLADEEWTGRAEP